MATISVDGQNFDQEVIQSELPVVVDFYADWCGPCKMVGPVIEELSGEYEGKVKFVKLDIDKAQDLAAKYSVASIPTLIFFKAGEKVNQMVGAQPKPQIEDQVKTLIS